MLSKKYNYDNYIEFDTEYRDLFSKFNNNGLINIYDVLTIRKRLPEELLVQLKRKHIQSEFSFRNIVQDDEVKYIKPKTKEELEQERIERSEELKKIEREKREAANELARQQEITKTIRDNIIKADEIKRITNEFDSWLKTVCELVHPSRILNYEKDDLVEIQKDITNDLKEIDPKTIIQSNMFGFKGKTYEELLIMLSDMFKKEVLEEFETEESEEEIEETDLESDEEFEFDYETEEDNEFESEEDNELVGNYNHDYDDDLEMYSVKYDKSKLWDSKRRKDNKVKSNKRFVSHRDKKRQDGLKGGNLEYRKKIFYYLISLFDEIYDSHIEQNKHRIDNILISEAYICIYNDNSYIDINLKDFRTNSNFDNVFTSVCEMYRQKDFRKKEIYDKLFDSKLYIYILPYVSKNNLLPLDHVKFIKEFVDRIKNKHEILEYKKELYEDNKDRNDQIDMNVKIYEIYGNVLDKEFINKIKKYDINFYTDGLSNLIKRNLSNMDSYKDRSYDLKDKHYNFETLISKLEISYKHNFGVSNFENKIIEVINKTYDFDKKENNSKFYNKRFKELVELYDKTKYEVIKKVIEHYADPKLFDVDYKILIDKLKVSYKYNFDVSDFKRKFIEAINKTYDFNKIESKSKFYDDCFTELIGLYDETKYEVVKNVIKHYTDPNLFNADIAEGGDVIIRKLYIDFHKKTEGYNLIKDYLKERIAYWIKWTNLKTYGRIFEYIEKYKEFTVTLHNKIVDKLEKEHKDYKDLKTYFETKVKQYKDKRFNEIVIIKEKLTLIIKDLIPRCEIYIINYYLDEQLKVFKEDIGNRVKELIINYYNGLSVDDFKIVDPKDEDSETLIISAFKDKDYGLNQQFYVNNDNKAKINLWKDFEECYRDCVVDKLKEIAVDLSFNDITYILFVSFRMQLVGESWINQILEIEKINETINDYLTNNLITVGDCINYLTASINLASSLILKYFFCIDKVAGIIKNICESDDKFDFNQYETLIDNENLSDEVREEIVNAMKDKLKDLFKRKLKDSSIDVYIKEYDNRKNDKRYEPALQVVVYDKLKKEIFEENDFKKTKEKFNTIVQNYKDYTRINNLQIYLDYFGYVFRYYCELYEDAENNERKIDAAKNAIENFKPWLADEDCRKLLNKEGYIVSWFKELINNCNLTVNDLLSLTKDELFMNYYDNLKTSYIKKVNEVIHNKFKDNFKELTVTYNTLKEIKNIETKEIIVVIRALYLNTYNTISEDIAKIIESYTNYFIEEFKDDINNKIEELVGLKKEPKTLKDWYVASNKLEFIHTTIEKRITTLGPMNNNILTWYFDDELINDDSIKTLYQTIIKDNANELTEGVGKLEINKIVTLYEDLNKFEDIVRDKIKSNYKDVYEVIKEYNPEANLKINQLFVSVLTSILKDKSTPINDYYELLNFISSIN